MIVRAKLVNLFNYFYGYSIYFRAIGRRFGVVRPSGHVKLCLLVFVNVITPVTVNIVLVKLIYTTNKCWICIFFLCLKASRHYVPAESNVIRFTVVTEWPLVEQWMLERTRHCFFSSQMFAWEACSLLEADVALWEHPLLLTQMQV